MRGSSSGSVLLVSKWLTETTSPGPGKGEVFHNQAKELVLGQLPQVE